MKVEAYGTWMLWGILAVAGVVGYLAVSRLIDWFSKDRPDPSKYYTMDSEDVQDDTIGGWDPKKPIE
ncbi:MAG: hypothetical protein GY906_03060 [bacterium]|nr:hypothetical protein [bacterium]